MDNVYLVQIRTKNINFQHVMETEEDFEIVKCVMSKVYRDWKSYQVQKQEEGVNQPAQDKEL